MPSYRPSRFGPRGDMSSTVTATFVMSSRMSSGNSSSASRTSRSKSGSPSSTISSILGRSGCLGEDAALAERLLQRSGHGRVVNRGEIVAQPLLQRRLRLVEERLLARLELEPGVCELPVGDAGQKGRAGRVAFNEAEACKRRERVGHDLLEAEVDSQ